MQGANHRLEFLHCPIRSRRAVAWIGCKEAERVISPVVCPAAVDEKTIVDVVMDWHQLDGGHSEIAQVADSCRRGQPGISAPQLFRHQRVLAGKTLDVDFVDYSLMPRCPRCAVITPAELRFDDASQRREWRTVTFVEIRVVASSMRIAIKRIVPAQVPGDGFGVRIEHDFVRVEAMTPLQLVGPVNSVAVELPGPEVRQIGVPHFFISFRKNDALRFGLCVDRVEKAELDLCCVLGEQRKVYPHAVPSGSKRIGTTGPDAHRL